MGEVNTTSNLITSGKEYTEYSPNIFIYSFLSLVIRFRCSFVSVMLRFHVEKRIFIQHTKVCEAPEVPVDPHLTPGHSVMEGSSTSTLDLQAKSPSSHAAHNAPYEK